MVLRWLLLLASLFPAVHPIGSSHVKHRTKVQASRAHLSSQRHSTGVDMLAVFMTGCSAAADWQSLGIYYSFLRSGQPGRMLRIAACLEDEAGHRTPTALVPTWTTDGVQTVGTITYPLFNKAWAIKQFMELEAPSEDYILVLDSDMIIRRPFLAADFRIARGRAASENMWYLEDLNSLLAPKLLPDSEVKPDWNAYPGAGRLADEVGEFYFLHREDLQNVAPLWWNLTLPVLRAILHRPASEEGKQSREKRLWYAEMHAYALGAADAGVHHLGSNSTIFHVTARHPHGLPNALHYAWEAKVPGLPWAFNKHEFGDFLAEKCPPWDLEAGREGLFPHPPSALLLNSTGGDLVRDLLNIEVGVTLNKAFCSLHHERHCASHAQAIEECSKVTQQLEDIKAVWDKLKKQHDLSCMDMLANGECRDTSKCDARYMTHLQRREFCRESCGHCSAERQ